jgi:N-acetylglucosaminyldiphosphoundecaprenol N-acetyl-beta-D-mannosaminyltransferase
VNPRFPPKHPIIGTPISITTFDDVQALMATPRTDRATVVAVCNVHSVMTARRQAELSQALRQADIATPDGMPLVWALRALGHNQRERVYGPELMRRALVDKQSKHRHFFFGSSSETLDKLLAAIRRLNPDVHIVGAIAPPFRALTQSEEDEVLDEIRRSGTKVVWVGLGMRKQELWMHRVKDRLPGVTLLGVGAAFDFLAGTTKQAPSWMQSSGLEWIYRLRQEPRRLWRRYLWNNPAFLLLVGLQVAKERAMRRRGIQEPH